jgi:hypothetical protein
MKYFFFILSIISVVIHITLLLNGCKYTLEDWAIFIFSCIILLAQIYLIKIED